MDADIARLYASLSPEKRAIVDAKISELLEKHGTACRAPHQVDTCPAQPPK